MFLVKSIPKIIIACWSAYTMIWSYPSFLAFLSSNRNPESYIFLYINILTVNYQWSVSSTSTIFLNIHTYIHNLLPWTKIWKSSNHHLPQIIQPCFWLGFSDERGWWRRCEGIVCRDVRFFTFSWLIYCKLTELNCLHFDSRTMSLPWQYTRLDQIDAEGLHLGNWSPIVNSHIRM